MHSTSSASHLWQLGRFRSHYRHHRSKDFYAGKTSDLWSVNLPMSSSHDSDCIQHHVSLILGDSNFALHVFCLVVVAVSVEVYSGCVRYTND